MMNVNLRARECVIDPTVAIGATVAWDFGLNSSADSVCIARADVREILKRHGFDPTRYLEAPAPERALAKAAREVHWGFRLKIKGVVVTKLPTEKGVPISFGVMITTTTEEDATASVGARVRVDASGGIVVASPVDGKLNEQAASIATAIRDHATHVMESCFNAELTAALTGVRKRCGAVPMRFNSGGAYFLPAGKDADRMVAVLENLEAATSNQPPAHQFMAHITVVGATARNVQTYQRSTAISFQQEVEELVGKLKSYNSRDNVRESSFEKARAACSALMRRADGVAALLEGHLDAIKSQLHKLETEFGTAQSQAQQALSAFNGLASNAASEPASEPSKTSKPSKAQQALAALAAFKF